MLDARACLARRTGDEDITVRPWRPLAENASLLAPALQLVPIGSVQAYLVPVGTHAAVKVIQQGMLPPLAVLTAETVPVGG